MTDPRDELFERLVRAVASDAALMLDGWHHLVLVSHLEAGTQDLTGFSYLDDGRAVPVSPSDFTIFDVLDALRQAMAEADRRPAWQAALFRFERATGAVTAEFDHDDPTRWAVRPDNVADRACELAPVRSPEEPPVQVTMITANLQVADVDSAKAFYTDFLGLSTEEFNLGWVARYTSPDTGAHVQLLTHDAASPEDPVVSVHVEDVDAAFAEAGRRGFEIVHPLTTEAWGVRRFLVRAPDGNVLNIVQHRD